MIVYQDIQGDCQIWTRPKSEWDDGRFTQIQPEIKIDKVALVCIRDRKLLMLRSHGKTVYYSPGGKREAGETDAECLARELSEEINVELNLDSMAHFGTVIAQSHGSPDGTLVKITFYTGLFEGTPIPGDIEEIRWLTYADREIVGCPIKLVMDELYHKNMIS